MNIQRFISTIIISLLISFHLSAQVKWNSAYQAYIDQYKDLAIEQMLRYNIPASITLSQGQDDASFRMMMSVVSASVLTTMRVKAMKTTADFYPHSHVMPNFSATHVPTTVVGREA